MGETPSDLEAHLLDFVRGRLIETGEGTGSDTDLFDAGLDSMGVMQLLIHLEETHGLRVPEDEITRENFATVGRLADLIRRGVGS